MKKKSKAKSGARVSGGPIKGAAKGASKGLTKSPGKASGPARAGKGAAKASKAPARKPARTSPKAPARALGKPAARPAAKKAPGKRGAGRLAIEVIETPTMPAPQAPAAGPVAGPVRGKAPARPGALSGEDFAIEAARMMHDDKCTDVVLIDVRGRSPMADFIVIGSGTSDRQMKSVLMHLEELGTRLKFPTRRVNQDDRATWLLADFFDVVAHLFEPNTRAHYDLEMLWGDAPRMAWERPDQMNRDRAGLNAG
jgi:ribosome-associated protein